MYTYQFTAGGTSYRAKAGKDAVAKVASAIGSVSKIKQYCRELTGVIGGECHTSEYYMLFGDGRQGAEMADPDGYEADKAAFLASIPETIGAQDISDICRRASEIVQKHMPVRDKRETPEARAARIAESNRLAAEQDAANAAKAAVAQAEAVALRAQYPYLCTSSEIGKNDRVTACTNMRTELARAFPGVKFSVTSETFSGGDSIDVRWQDGPTDKEVNAIIKKYQDYALDYTGDFMDYVGDTFNRTFGNAKFVSAARDYSRETIAALAEWDQAQMLREQEEIGDFYRGSAMRRLMGETALPGGAVVTGVVARADGEWNADSNDLAYFWRVVFEVPAAAAQDSNPQRPEGGATPANGKSRASDGTAFEISHERDWTWIRFDGKPARPVLDACSGLGAQWGYKRSAWYIKRHVDAAVVVTALAGAAVYDGGARGMEMAAGIAEY